MLPSAGMSVGWVWYSLPLALQAQPMPTAKKRPDRSVLRVGSSLGWCIGGKILPSRCRPSPAWLPQATNGPGWTS